MTTQDQLTKETVVQAMKHYDGLDASSIEVNKVQGIIFLKGTVREEFEKALAEQIAFSLPGVVEVVNNLSIENKTAEKISQAFDTKIEVMMRLNSVAHVRILEPEVDVENGTVILQGIVDAFWKRAYLGNILESEFPDIYVENQLTVVPAQESSFLPEENPVKEPETFHQARAGYQARAGFQKKRHL